MNCSLHWALRGGPGIEPNVLTHMESVKNFVYEFECMSTLQLVWFFFQLVFSLWHFVLVNSSIFMSALYLPRLRRLEDTAVGDLPVVAVVIPCYLPNEIHVIEETLACVCASKYDGEFTVLVPYNTPEPTSRDEKRLQDIVCVGTRAVSIHKVVDSTSKAENVMHAVRNMCDANVDMVVIFDADHRPEPHTVSRMVTLLAHNPTFVAVQGAVHVVRAGPAWLRCMAGGMEWVAWNFYAPGMSLVVGSAWFAGGNAVWRASDLKELGMDASCMTEDVDLSVRAMLSGHRIMLAPWARVGEVCPSGLRAFVRQRLRWGVGWEQVTMRMVPKTLASSLGTSRKLQILALLFARHLSTGAGMLAMCDALIRAVNHMKSGINAIALPISMLSSLSGYTSASAAVSIVAILAFNGEDTTTTLRTFTFLLFSPIFVVFQLFTIVHSWVSLTFCKLYWVPTARSTSDPTHRIALKSSNAVEAIPEVVAQRTKKHRHVRLPKDTEDAVEEP